MKKQVNVSLTILMSFYPEDLGLDDNATRTELMDYTDVEINKVISQIHDATGLTVDDIETEVCEMR